MPRLLFALQCRPIFGSGGSISVVFLVLKYSGIYRILSVLTNLDLVGILLDVKNQVKSKTFLHSEPLMKNQLTPKNRKIN